MQEPDDERTPPTEAELAELVGVIAQVEDLGRRIDKGDHPNGHAGAVLRQLNYWLAYWTEPDWEEELTQEERARLVPDEESGDEGEGASPEDALVYLSVDDYIGNMAAVG